MNSTTKNETRKTCGGCFILVATHEPGKVIIGNTEYHKQCAPKESEQPAIKTRGSKNRDQVLQV